MNSAFLISDSVSLDPLPHKDPRNTRGRHAYSFLRALAGVANPFGDRRGDWDVQPRGLEGEVDQELRKRYPHMRPRGFLAPSSFDDAEEVRALTSSTGSGAIGDVVVIPVVEALRSKTALGAMGAQVRRLPVDSRGVGWIPRLKSTASVGWLVEGADAPESSPQYDGLELTPKTAAATVPVSRTMLRSAYTADFEQMVADDVATGIAVEVDRIAIAGTAGGVLPVGLLNVPGTKSVELGVNGGTPTRDALVELERLVGVANGDAGADARLGWIASSNARARLRKLDGSTAGSGAWVW
ncbi:phage major capsid protein, partial [Paludisphaera rhizosphaerae]|uniref:phage major capsid protein n=1 Tax=Paludisphaera rhizosphaerae TaxID=2711216 RepID=UPI0013EBBBC4